MLEWLKRHAWKACVPQKGIRSSNLLLSADNGLAEICRPFFISCAPKSAFFFNSELRIGNLGGYSSFTGQEK